jgi:plastocyanin
MRLRTLFVVSSLVLFSTSLSAKDVYLSVSGKANGFFSDARIFNPSFTKDIVVTARYLPAGNADNSAAAGVPLTIPKRTMKVYDDAVQTIFGGGAPLGAIRLTSDDDFVASQRIYQDARSGPQQGTLGQFVPGLDAGTAKTKGVILQLKSGPAAVGNFRTNWGGVNPNPVVANIAFELRDRNGALAGTNNLTLQPFGVFSPTNIVPFFGATADLSDAWISFVSDQPVFLYGSVVDNGSVDPTFVPAVEDSGVAPAPQQKTVTVTARNFAFTVTGGTDLRAGDQVKFIVSKSEGTHGFLLSAPSGAALIDLDLMPNAPTEFVVTLPASGVYGFICTNSACGSGHATMFGSITVGSASSSSPSIVKVSAGAQEEGHHHHR